MKPIIPSLLLAAAGLLAFGHASLRAAAAGDADGQAQAQAEIARTLHETGLYAAGSARVPSDDVVAFSPQYPLWTDGADKRRWLHIPQGAFIDASQPDAWEFPPGTKLWKEFAHQGRPVETRYMERRRDGSWLFATYVWNEAGDEAVLAPERGIPALAFAAAPGGRYTVPSRTDCLACHGSTKVPVLGASALQLSPERDPLAPGGRPLGAGEADLRGLAKRGWVRGLPAALIEQPPTIAGRTPVERAALGYLHANCGHCHNTSDSRVPVRLTLAQRAADASAARDEVLRSALEARSRYRPTEGGPSARVVEPGRPEHSLLTLRMHTRDPRVQMPPLGTSVPDALGIALVERWIANDLSTERRTSP